MTPRPLAGYVVLDLSQYIAGPTCGQILADFGATVIKVEPPTGDPSRGLGSSRFGSTYFRQYNTGKEGLRLDLGSDDGRRELDARLSSAAAVVMNFSARTLEKLGLHWEQLHARFPHLVVVSVSAYGYGDQRTAFDSIAQAVSGYGYLNADEEGIPRITGGYPTDVMSGLYAGLSAAMTLLDPARTEGVLVDVPMVEVAMNSLCGPSILNAAAGEPVRVGRGNRDLTTSPSNVYRCSDGHVYIYAGLDKHWERLRTVVGGEIASLDERVADAERFDAVVEQWTQSRSVSEVCDVVSGLGIAVGAVLPPGEALTTYQQGSPGAVVSIDRASGPFPQFPVTFSGERVPRRPAPAPTQGVKT